MAAGVILSPIGLLICFLIPTIAIFIAKSPLISAARLAAGYVGALFMLAVVVATSSYISPEETNSVWHIPPDRYWSALIEEFIANMAVMSFAAILGISVVVLPVLALLSSVKLATAPWLIASSAVISILSAIFFIYVLMQSSTNDTFLGTLWFLVGTHFLLALGFGLAARLPWTLRDLARM